MEIQPLVQLPDDDNPATERTGKTPFRLMSFDGGGVHAVSYLPVIADLERHLGRKTTIASCGQFQMLAGTSTGAIVAAALKLGTPANRILDMYLLNADEIFCKARKWHWPFFLYPSDPLRNILAEFYQKQTNRSTDVTWRELAEQSSYPELELVVTLWDVIRERTAFLSTNLNRPNQAEELWDAALADVITACCSAPVFFPARWFRSVGAEYAFCDGGITGLNSPATFGVSLIHRTLTVHKVPLHVVSFGAGEASEAETASVTPTIQQFRNRSVLQLAPAAITALMNSTSRLMDQFYDAFGSTLNVARYLRTNHHRGPESKLDDAAIVPQLATQFAEGAIYYDLCRSAEGSDGDKTGVSRTRQQHSKDKIGGWAEMWTTEFDLISVAGIDSNGSRIVPPLRDISLPCPATDETIRQLDHGHEPIGSPQVESDSGAQRETEGRLGADAAEVSSRLVESGEIRPTWKAILTVPMVAVFAVAFVFAAFLAVIGLFVARAAEKVAVQQREIAEIEKGKADIRKLEANIATVNEHAARSVLHALIPGQEHLAVKNALQAADEADAITHDSKGKHLVAGRVVEGLSASLQSARRSYRIRTLDKLLTAPDAHAFLRTVEETPILFAVTESYIEPVSVSLSSESLVPRRFERPHKYRVSSSGRVTAVVLSNGVVQISGTPTNLRFQIPFPPNTPPEIRETVKYSDCSLSPDGLMAILSTTTGDFILVLTDTPPMTPSFAFTQQEPPRFVQFAPDPEMYVLVLGFDDRIEFLTLGPQASPGELFHHWHTMLNRLNQATPSSVPITPAETLEQVVVPETRKECFAWRTSSGRIGVRIKQQSSTLERAPVPLSIDTDSNGSRLVTIDREGVTLFSCERNGKVDLSEVRRITTGDEPLVTGFLTADGNGLITLNRDGIVRRTNLTGLFTTMPDSEGSFPVVGLNVDDDGNRVISTDQNGRVRQIDDGLELASSRLDEFLPKGIDLTHFAWSDDGDYTAAITRNNNLFVWKDETLINIPKPENADAVWGSGMVTAVAFIPGTGRLLVTTLDGLFIWDLAAMSLKQLDSAENTVGFSGIRTSVSQAGFIAWTLGKNLWCYRDAASPPNVIETDFRGTVSDAIPLGPDSVAAISDLGELEIRSVDDGHLQSGKNLEEHGNHITSGSWRLRPSPNNALLLVKPRRSLRMHDLVVFDKQGGEIGRPEEPSDVVFCDFVSDNKILMANSDGELFLWDFVSKQIVQMPGHPSGTTTATLSRNRKWYALAANDGSVRIFPTGLAELQQLQNTLVEQLRPFLNR